MTTAIVLTALAIVVVAASNICMWRVWREVRRIRRLYQQMRRDAGRDEAEKAKQ